MRRYLAPDFSGMTKVTKPSSTVTCRCPTRGETARALAPNTGTRCRFSVQYSIITTPREASGSGSGASMTILAGGSLATGITAGRHLSFAPCATAVVAHSTMAATDSRDAPFEPGYSRLAMFLPPVSIQCTSDDGANRLDLGVGDTLVSVDAAGTSLLVP